MAAVYDSEDKQPQTNNSEGSEENNGAFADSLKNQEYNAANEQPELSETEALERIQSGLDRTTAKPEVQEGIQDFFKGGSPPQSFADKASFIAKNKGMIAGVGGGLFGLILAISAMFGLLNSFTLDNLMTNIEAKSFIRYQVAMDGRSSKWVQAYMTVRLSEDFDLKDADGNPTPAVFKAAGVDNNKPLTDWYRTLRSSNFERDVFNKHGIIFASTRNADGSFSPVRLTVNNQDALAGLTDEERDNIRNGRINNISPELRERIFRLETLGSDREGRANLRQIIRDETHWWQAMKRRHIRQDIQNRTGIRDWRFFEKTRDRIDNKQIDIRNKIVTKAFPDDNKAGKVVQCLFGILPVDQCRGGADPSNPENRATNPGETGPDGSNPDEPPTPIEEGGVDENGRPIRSTGVNTALVEKLIKKFLPVANLLDIVGTFDMIANSVKSAAGIKGLVASYKATQAIGFFTVFTIARDQLKTGDATGEEIGQFMELAGSVNNNEYYTTVIAEQPIKAAAAAETLQNAKNKEEYCAPKFQEELAKPENASEVNNLYTWNCPDKQIGGTNDAVSGIDAFFNTEFGKALVSIANLWSAATDNVFGAVIRSINNVIGIVITSVTKPLLDALGISDKVEEVGALGINKIAEAAGLNSLVDDTPTPIAGQFVNAAGQGGAATAEMAARSQGAMATTPQTRKESVDAVAMYTKDELNNQSLFTKYASLGNPKSLATKLALSTNENKSKLATIPSKLSTGIFSLFSFSKPSYAAASPYTASSFAGIQTFDYPSQCTNADPLTATPQTSTNIQAVLPGKVTDAELTWQLVTDKIAFYDFLYQKLGTDVDADTKAMSVYNCALMDNAVRGGLGAVYGYTQDNGLGGQ